MAILTPPKNPGCHRCKRPPPFLRIAESEGPSMTSRPDRSRDRSPDRDVIEGPSLTTFSGTEADACSGDSQGSSESDHSGRRRGSKTVTKVISSENDPPPEPSQQPEETEKVRAYFPETWIWELVALGESGKIDIQHKVPDTITDWNAGAICMGPNGFGLSPSSSLRVFQPFFVDLTLPYSVVRGETFTLKASVFNYLKQCIKICDKI
ncbi:unnamed protein product [Ranitomeya imitator]|uniref:Alpha-2-macroglobulin domain-containing protein n=1 Tax=Ranitomeya imitator TaxID=111125 RepID=A0ABN9L8J8_9NEOB|nr:unnamed protein product [Ranitomeya imitator]